MHNPLVQTSPALNRMCRRQFCTSGSRTSDKGRDFSFNQLGTYWDRASGLVSLAYPRFLSSRVCAFHMNKLYYALLAFAAAATASPTSAQAIHVCVDENSGLFRYASTAGCRKGESPL